MIKHPTLFLFAQAGQPGPADLLRGPMIPMLIMMAAFFFIMQRSQSKKAKEHEALLKSMKAGDKVLTASGIIGTIISVKDKSVSVRSADTKLEILKSAVSEITERSGAESKES
jgi:preprotein translocase subunit YajC